MRKLVPTLVLILFVATLAQARVENFVLFINQVIRNATNGAPLSASATGTLVSGISNSEATATGTITTTSASDVLATSMTLTPASGTYFAIASSCVDHSNQNVAVTMTLYSGGSSVTHSVRSTIPRTNAIGAITMSHCFSTQGVVTVNGSQAIELRWNRGSAGTGTMYQRSLFITRLQ